MTSSDVYMFKQNLKNYIATSQVPKEVARMVLKELYTEIRDEALQDIIKEMEEAKE